MQESIEVRVDQMVANEEVDRELDQFIEAHALKSKFTKDYQFFELADGMNNSKVKLQKEVGFELQLEKTPATVRQEMSPLNPRRLAGSFLLRQNLS